MQEEFVIALAGEDWQYNLLTEISGVRLAEIGVGVYQVDFFDTNHRRQHSVFYDYSAAEAAYVRHVAEEDYR